MPDRDAQPEPLREGSERPRGEHVKRLNRGWFRSSSYGYGDAAVLAFLVKHKWSEQQLANALGVSRRCVQRWVNKKRMTPLAKMALRGLEVGTPEPDMVRSLEEYCRCLLRLNLYLEQQLKALRVPTRSDAPSGPTSYSSLDLAGSVSRPFILRY